MNKIIQRFSYGILGLSLLFIYGASFKGITPSVFWEKSGISSIKETFSVPYDILKTAPCPLAPNLYVGSSEELHRVFERADFSLDQARQGMGNIPKLYLAKLPSDFKKQLSPQKRQMVFLQTVLPIIIEVNQGILKMREQLEGLQKKVQLGQSLSQEEETYLAQLYQDYNVKDCNLDKLLQKVDIIPVSLTLAQGILESGWGTSALAQKSNSLFGHTNNNNTMKRFSSLVGTVEYHVKNLNRHAAYADFRKRRAQLRKKEGQILNAHHLAEGLKPYSERGMRYVQDIRRIMKQYQLYQFDDHPSLHYRHPPHEGRNA